MNVSLPEDLATRVKLHLHSDVEGKIPHGKQQQFFTEVVLAAFEGRIAYAGVPQNPPKVGDEND
jgi:hypothetical protein